ncbi:MAG: hypothetical protein IKE46_00640 [Selenomonadaceae bacterium]|nr:hypothetical protein [Selenomonadaceae bacterium]
MRLCSTKNVAPQRNFFKLKADIPNCQEKISATNTQVFDKIAKPTTSPNCSAAFKRLKKNLR